MAPTTTETNDIEALLTVITKEDLEGTIAQLRAAVNVFAKNPKPAIAENAKALVDSLLTKAKTITSHAVLAHKTLEDLEKTCEAKATATLAAEKQKWTSYAAHLTDQLASCNQELAQARTGHTQPRAAAQRTAQSEPTFTPSQKAAVRETIRKAWIHLQNPLSYLLRLQQPLTIPLIKQTLPLERLGLHYSVHDTIYFALYKSLLDEREQLRKEGPYARLHNHISNVFHAMMNALGY